MTSDEQGNLSREYNVKQFPPNRMLFLWQFTLNSRQALVLYQSPFESQNKADEINKPLSLTSKKSPRAGIRPSKIAPASLNSSWFIHNTRLYGAINSEEAASLTHILWESFSDDKKIVSVSSQ